MDEELLYDDSMLAELDDSTRIKTINPIQGIKGISANQGMTSSGVHNATTLDLGGVAPTQTESQVPTSSEPGESATTSTAKRYGMTVKEEDEAKAAAELDYATGVSHVRDVETEDYVSTKELYQKTLGVTEYEELRAKCNLEDWESFTDYYNRTHYVPKGFEIQAKLLLAEEKRKKLYAEVQAGNMSEEDFLYEAYGKDLLKQKGIDFSSPLYWYNRFQSGDYSDLRDNDALMLDLIEDCRKLFQGETWYKEKASTKLSEVLAGVATGVELSNETVEEIFKEQFDVLTKEVDDVDLLIRYYRGGLLRGFNPLIDKDGDGKYDYYYAPDGKLYNVNETGEGANTFKIVYNKNSDGSYFKNKDGSYTYPVTLSLP